MSPIAAPLRLSTTSADFEAQFAARLHWSADTDSAIEQRVADILADVQRRGDAAVLEYTARFDDLSVDNLQALELNQTELKTAFDGLPAAQRDALESAARRVRSYHEAQKRASGESWSYRDEDGTDTSGLSGDSKISLMAAYRKDTGYFHQGQPIPFEELPMWQSSPNTYKVRAYASHTGAFFRKPQPCWLNVC